MHKSEEKSETKLFGRESRIKFEADWE